MTENNATDTHIKSRHIILVYIQNAARILYSLRLNSFSSGSQKKKIFPNFTVCT